MICPINKFDILLEGNKKTTGSFNIKIMLRRARKITEARVRMATGPGRFQEGGREKVNRSAADAACWQRCWDTQGDTWLRMKAEETMAVEGPGAGVCRAPLTDSAVKEWVMGFFPSAFHL